MITLNLVAHTIRNFESLALQIMNHFFGTISSLSKEDHIFLKNHNKPFRQDKNYRQFSASGEYFSESSLSLVHIVVSQIEIEKLPKVRQKEDLISLKCKKTQTAYVSVVFNSFLSKVMLIMDKFRARFIIKVFQITYDIRKKLTCIL